MTKKPARRAATARRAARANGPARASRARAVAPRIAPGNVHDVLGKHLLVDGYDLVLDLEKSKGRRLKDARGNRWYLDLFSCFATLPIGLNHPGMKDPAFARYLPRWGQLFEQAEIVELAECGHAPPEERAPESRLFLTRFLER